MGMTNPESDPVLTVVGGIEARAIRLEVLLKAIADDVRRHATHFEGNGRDGIIVRIDRLEQRWKSYLREQAENAASAKLDAQRQKVFGLRLEVILASIGFAAGLLSFVSQFMIGG